MITEAIKADPRAAQGSRDAGTSCRPPQRNHHLRNRVVNDMYRAKPVREIRRSPGLRIPHLRNLRPKVGIVSWTWSSRGLSLIELCHQAEHRTAPSDTAATACFRALGAEKSLCAEALATFRTAKPKTSALRQPYLDGLWA